MGVYAAEAVWQKGHVPFVPQLSYWYGTMAEHTHEEWMAYDFQWLQLCDGLLRLPGESKGADMEVDFCEVKNIAVYYNLDDIPPLKKEG